MAFDDFDTGFASAPLPDGSGKRAEITAERFAALAAPEVPCGFFTLTLPDGARKRFRVRLERGSFLTGQRTLSRYCKLEADDEKEREWETIAVVGPEGFRMFKRFRGDWEERWALAIWRLLHREEVPASPLGEYVLEVEPRCWLCMRELKTDEQRLVGLTPGCAKKVGL